MEVCCLADSIHVPVEAELTIQGDPTTFDGIGRLDFATGNQDGPNLVCDINVGPVISMLARVPQNKTRLRRIKGKTVVREPFE